MALSRLRARIKALELRSDARAHPLRILTPEMADAIRREILFDDDEDDGTDERPPRFFTEEQADEIRGRILFGK